jgi:large repetitive protein
MEVCGDGVLSNFANFANLYWNYLHANECDDGNNRPGDGCDPLCRVEKGYYCNRFMPDITYQPLATGPNLESICRPICGDWRKFWDEHCDDGNTIAGDGCSAICHEEPGMKCIGGWHHWKDECYEPCGDGLNNGFFVCDDGNILSGDGCSSTCTLETGF